MHHANEYHAALAGLELIAKYGSIEEARKHFVFTTHTPVPAGLDIFSRQLAEQVLGEGMPSSDYMNSLTGTSDLNMARLAMALASQAFGVLHCMLKYQDICFLIFRIWANCIA